MALRKVIVWTLCLGIVVLLMSTSVQAKELTEVNATDILKQIENEENITLSHVNITGELDLSARKLNTTPIARSERGIKSHGLEEELKIVESQIEIHDSVFGDDVDFSNTQFRKDIDFSGTSFSGEVDFRGANFSGGAYFGDADFSGAFFNSTEFNKVSFTGTTFTNVFLIESDFNQMKVEWHSLKDALVFDGPTNTKILIL